MKLAAAIALALLASCDEGVDPPGEPDAGTQRRMVLALGTVDGTGHGFLSLDGDQPLVPGAQSGFHVWLKYRVAGHHEGAVRVKRTARRVSDGKAVLITEGAQQLGPPGADGWWEIPDPIPSFMCPSPLGVNIVGEKLRFTIELDDPDTGEALGSASAEVTPHCPEDDQKDWCMRICTG